MRDAGVSLNSSSVRALLVSALEKDGYANLLSSHLLDPDGAQCELYRMICAATSHHVSVTLSTRPAAAGAPNTCSSGYNASAQTTLRACRRRRQYEVLLQRPGCAASCTIV